MQRFQVPYNLKAIPEVQEFLNFVFQDSRKTGDFHDLYRRRFVSIDIYFGSRSNSVHSSLLVEPRQPADTAPTPSTERPMFTWTRSLSQASLSTLS
jgi:son of sevenless